MALLENSRRNVKWLRVLAIFYPIGALLSYVIPIKYILNTYLGKLNGFSGHVQSVRLSVFSMSISVKGFYLDKVDKASGQKSLFVSAEAIVLNIKWPTLFAEEIIAEVDIDSPSFTFNKKHVSYPKKGNPLHKLDLGMDVTIKRFDIKNGSLEFIDEDISPALILKATDINLSALNMATNPTTEKHHPSDLTLHAKVYEGTVTIDLKASVIDEHPEFDMMANICGLNLVLLNDFFRAYGKFDLHHGILNMNAEIFAEQGRFKGQLESVIQDLDFVGPEDAGDSILSRLWEALLGTVTEILENNKTDELATKLPFEGTFKNPKVHIGYAIVEVLSNAFLHGLRTSIHCDLNLMNGKKN